MGSLSTVAAIAITIGAPLVYADQAWSIAKKRNAEGFSKDVSAILLIANICRCFFWFGEHFEFALLLQSLLMIAAQLYLLWLCIRYRPGSYASSAFTAAPSDARSAQGQPPSFSFTVTPASPSDVRAPQPEPVSTGARNQDQSSRGGHGLLDSALGLGGSRGRYSPLLSLNLPPPPTLALEGDASTEDDEAGNNSNGRGSLRRAKSMLKAALSVGAGSRADGSSGARIFGFWTWPHYSSYIIFLLVLILLLGLLQLLLGGLKTYVSVLGFFALGLESTLPIPQALKNYERKSLAGFRTSVLLGWAGGDLFKTVYFIFNHSPLQFTVCAIFQLSIDALIFVQMRLYAEQTARDEETQALAAAEAMEASERERADIGDEGVRSNLGSTRTGAGARTGAGGGGGAPHEPSSQADHTIFQIEADDDDDEEGSGKGRRRP